MPWIHADNLIALWFHARLTPTLAHLMQALSEPGSGIWIGAVLAITVIALLVKRRWYGLLAVMLTVPGGMLLGEGIKLLVQRQRPFLTGPFVDWSGYSFPSGHTIGATLLYGLMTLFLLRRLKARHLRVLTILFAATLVTLVGLSRIALGAHYLTDVAAAMVLGVIWLAICSTLVELLRRSRSHASVLVTS